MIALWIILGVIGFLIAAPFIGWAMAWWIVRTSDLLDRFMPRIHK